MIAWLKRFILGGLLNEVQTELSALIKKEQAQVQTLNPDDLSKKIVDLIREKIGIQGG